MDGSRSRFSMVVDPKCSGLGTQPQLLTRFGFQKHEILNGYVSTVPGLANTDKNSCKWNIHNIICYIDN